jgi:hypothetical protein
MQRNLATYSQLAVMAAVVATILYVPFGLIVALAGRLAGVTLAGVVTFGGALPAVVGLIAWWLVAFAGAMIYAAAFFPWKEKELAWPDKK